jgi:putative membrane protein
VLAGRYFRLSNLSYGLFALFLVFHLVGSHYTYAEVPFGFTLQRWLDSDRNMYDRLVHFLFGLLLAYPVREIFVRITRARGVWALYLPLELVMAFSGLFELVEWGVVAVAAPEAGAAYLGTQGDEWDAHKDMALAALGALVTMTVTLLALLRLDPKTPAVLRESLTLPPDDKPLGEVGIDRLLRRKRRREAAKRRG